MTGVYRSIERLIYQYASLIDAGDFDAVGGLFSSASLIYMPLGRPISGRDKISQHFRQQIIIYPETGTPCTLHQVSNLIIDIDSVNQTAVANSIYNAWQCLPDSEPKLLSMGRYGDRFKLIDGVWCFTERKVSPMYFGDLTGHLRGAEKWQQAPHYLVK